MSQVVQQEVLRQAWLEGRDGNLNALGEAKAWALREVWRANHDNDYGLLPFVAARVAKCGFDEEHPSTSALYQLFSKMDGDDAWFPGKSYQVKHGPAKALNGTCVQAIATSAMAAKKRKIEPTYKLIVGSCENAIINPDTGKPVDKKIVYEIFRKNCFDENADEPWQHKARYSKTALPGQMTVRRLAFGEHVQAWGLSAVWYFHNIVWVDLCNSILPLSETKASDQALSRKGKKGWGSPGCELATCNLRGDKASEKQNSWDTMKIWWAPILSRGKLHIEIFDANFPGENSAGAAVLVAKTRAAVNVRFQSHDTLPKIMWTDRGKGFYSNLNGRITGTAAALCKKPSTWEERPLVSCEHRWERGGDTVSVRIVWVGCDSFNPRGFAFYTRFLCRTLRGKFKLALAEHCFTAMLGEDGSIQPGRLQELMLHETVVSWIRNRLAKSVPTRAWEESRDAYTARLKACGEDINRTCRLDDLCHAFPHRIDTLVDRQGGRLRW